MFIRRPTCTDWCDQSQFEDWLHTPLCNRLADEADCPEWCDHEGECTETRAAIYAAERDAESAWLRAAEAPLP